MDIESNKKVQKRLLYATIASVFSCAPQVGAQDLAPVDFALKSYTTPTLDFLNAQGITKDLQVSVDGYITSGTSSDICPTSSYALTELTNINPENIPQSAVVRYLKTYETQYFDPTTGVRVDTNNLDSNINYKEYLIPKVEEKYFELTQLEPNKSLDNGNHIGDYINNTITNFNYGSLVVEDGKNIIGDFINNTLNDNDLYRPSRGAGLSVTGTVENIVATFHNNVIQDNHITSTGGAIYNSGFISSIIGEFTGNSSYSGGVLYNTGNIDFIKADFIANKNTYISNIHNTGTIGTLKGDFINNKGVLLSVDQGKIDTIDGNIVNNTGDCVKTFRAEIGEILADFMYNTGRGISNSYGTIGLISGQFINNKIEMVHLGQSQTTSGIAVYNYEGFIHEIIGEFIGNGITTRNTYGAMGGAIHNISIKGEDTGIIDEIRSDFIGNFVHADDTKLDQDRNTMGGAIYNTGIIKNIVNSNFIGNFAKCTRGTAQGGAIYTTRDIKISADNGTSEFTGNYVQVGDGEKDYQAVFIAQAQPTDQYGYIFDIPATLTLEAKNNGTIIFNDKIAGISDVIQERHKTYTNPETEESGIRYYDDNLEEITDLSKLTYANYKIDIKGDSTGQIILNNNIEGHRPDGSLGSADINLYSSVLRLGSRDNVLDGNNLFMQGGALNMINSQIGMASLNNLTISTNSNLYLDVDLENKEMDRISASTYGEHTGSIIVSGMNLISDLKPEESFGAIYFADADLKSHIVNGITQTTDYQQTGLTQLFTPIYRYNVKYDTENEYDNKGNGGYFLFTKGDKIFVEPGNENNNQGGNTPDVDPGNNNPGGNTSGGNSDNNNQGGNNSGNNSENNSGNESPGGSSSIIPPVINPGGGNIAPSGNPSDAFNPAVLASPVAAVAGSLAAMNHSYNYSFQNADNFMSLPYFERLALRDKNKLAIAETNINGIGAYSPLLTKQETNSVWVKPYSMFGNLTLNNGPKVDSINYGTLIGFDGEMEHLENGWDRVWSGYIGYNGANMHYSGVDTIQTGGLIGSTLTMYKKNFFNATTISAGANVAHTTNMYGNEHFTMLTSGIANKSGLNIEFKEGKLILQPSMLVGYSFVNTFDYTNAAGINIDAKPLHAIQLSPGIKLIGNLKNGWQPYIGVNMMWNIMGESNFQADGVKLPEMSIKPYVQYGVGVQKRVKDNYMAYGQAMVQNGGRNGVLLSAGFRWAVGRDSKNEKVSNPTNTRKVLKSPSVKKAQLQ